MISLSGAEAVVECPTSAALPHVKDSGSDASHAGDARHLYLSRVAELGPDAALALVPAEHRQSCADIDLAQLPLGAGYETEVAYAFDWSTGRARLLGRLLDRRYEVTPTETPGTADVVSTAERSRAQGYVEVDDYKGPHAHLTPAARNWQLRMLAVCACQVQGVPSARVRLGRLLEDGSTSWDTAFLDAFDLDAAAIEFQQAMRAGETAKLAVAGGGMPDLHQGDHCIDCPAFVSCPATGAMIRMMAVQPVTFAASIREQLDHHPARAFVQLKRAQAALKAVSDAVYAVAKHEPIDLGDGTEFGPRVSTREQLDGRVTYAVLEQMFGREVADATVSYDATKAALERELRKLATKRGELGRMREDVLEQVRRRGGVTARQSETMGVHRRDAALPAANEAKAS